MRLYHPEAELKGEIKLSKEQQRHIRVLRLKPEESIFVFDGRGKEYKGVYITKVRDTLLLEEEITPRAEPATRITLAVAPAKGNRMDILVEKTTELGVAEIIPLLCERSIVKPGEGKIKRWRKLAEEACAQSGRATLPTVQNPLDFDALIGKVREYDKAYICNPEGQASKISGKNILLIIGPEGGFTANELKKAEESGCERLILSPTILRIETAGITAIAQVVGRNI